MIKHCPITSGRGNTYSQRICEEEKCALWDETRNQCCFKTQALAAVADPLDKIREQAMYIPVRPTTGEKPFNAEYSTISQDDEPFEPKYIPY